MSEKRSMRFQPRHVVGLVAIAAFAVALRPVASDAAGSLMSIVDGTTSATAKVDGAGNLHVLTHAGDRPVKILDKTIGGPTPTTIDTSGYRSVQVYAYPYDPGLVASPAADTLRVSVPFRADKSTTAPEGSMTLAAWASGNPLIKRPGPAQELVRNAPQPSLQFTVSTGAPSLGMYFWRVIVYGMK